jgi:hypothetical protein
MLALFPLFFFGCWIFATVEGASVTIKVNSDEGGSSQFIFEHSTASNLDLLEAIKGFCASLKNMDPLYCQTNVYAEYNKIKEQEMSVPEWLRKEEVLSNFSEDLLTVACNEKNLVNYENLNDCQQKTGDAIRSVKMVQASFYLTDIVNHIDNNQIIPVPSNWKLNVEGHTFMFEGKKRLLQELADDPRVESICEIGLNLGHSVSYVFILHVHN